MMKQRWSVCTIEISAKTESNCMYIFKGDLGLTLAENILYYAPVVLVLLQ